MLEKFADTGMNVKHLVFDQPMTSEVRFDPQKHIPLEYWKRIEESVVQEKDNDTWKSVLSSAHLALLGRGVAIGEDEARKTLHKGLSSTTVPRYRSEAVHAFGALEVFGTRPLNVHTRRSACIEAMQFLETNRLTWDMANLCFWIGLMGYGDSITPAQIEKIRTHWEHRRERADLGIAYGSALRALGERVEPTQRERKLLLDPDLLLKEVTQDPGALAVRIAYLMGHEPEKSGNCMRLVEARQSAAPELIHPTPEILQFIQEI